MTEPNHFRHYIYAVWVTEDIRARFGVTEEEAREFLRTYGKWITESMIQAGWIAINIFGEHIGWTPRSLEETDEALDQLIRDELGEGPPSSDIDWRHEGF